MTEISKDPVGRKAILSAPRASRIQFTLTNENIQKFLFAGVFFTLCLQTLVYELYWDDFVANIGSFHLHIVDIAAVELVVLAGLRLGFPKFVSISAIFASLMVGCFMISAMRGLRALSADQLVYWRNNISLIFSALALIAVSSNIKREEISYKSIIPIIITFTYLFTALFVLRSMKGYTAIGSISSGNLAQLSFNENRILSAGSAIFLAFSSITLLSAASEGNVKRPKLYLATSVLAFALLIMTRQRSATLAGGVGLIVFLIFNPTLLLRSGFIGRLAIICLIGIAVVLSIGIGVYGANLLPEEYRVALDKRSTLDTRQLIWQGANVQFQSRNWLNRLIGLPLNERDFFEINGSRWMEVMHNQFVQSKMDLGYVGVWSLVGMLGASLLSAARRFRSNDVNQFGLPAGLAISYISISVTFGYSYSFIMSASVFSMLAVGYWPTLRKAAR